MKFNMKRLLSFALALVLTMSLALPVAAEEDSSNVAKIGETEYATLSLALADAQNGETTITLISDIELTEALVISADVNAVLDLNGHTISQTKEQTAAYSMITNKGTLTIVDSGENGAITYVDSGNGGEYVSNTILNEGSLTVSGGTISNKSSATVATNGYPHAIDARGRVVLNGGVITCDEYSAIRIWCTETAATVEIYEGATINGAVDFHNVSNKTNIGNLIISGGTFNQTKNVNVIRVLNFGFDLSKMTGIITGGTFNGNIKIFNYSGDDAVIGDVFTVSGGYFVEVPDAVAEGYVSDVKVGDYYVVHKHNSDKELPAKAATCTEDGLTAGKACSVCGETQVPQEIVPATDHDWGYRSGVTAEGNKHWMWCRNFCGADIKEMGDHVYTHSDDLSKYRVMHESECGSVLYCLPVCEVCGFDGPLAAAQKKVYKEDGEHVFDEGVVTREATCSQTGEIVYTCTYELCGFKKTEELPVIEHAWSKDFQPGTDTHWHYCTNEGCTAKKDEASHTFAEIKDFAYAVKGNECAAEFIQQCSVCGKGNPDKTFWAAAENPVHTYDDGVVTKESTCSEAGVKTYTCTNEGCGHTKTEAVEKKAHTEVLVPGKDATCTEKGLTAGKKCSVCGEVTVAQTEVAATGHKLTKVEAKEATYTAAGVKEHYT